MEIDQIVEVQYLGMVDDLVERYNEITGKSLEFEIDQYYGTDCYDFVKVDNISDEVMLRNADDFIINYNGREYVSQPHGIVYWLILNGHIPRKNVLVEINY